MNTLTNMSPRTMMSSLIKSKDNMRSRMSRNWILSRNENLQRSCSKKKEKKRVGFWESKSQKSWRQKEKSHYDEYINCTLKIFLKRFIKKLKDDCKVCTFSSICNILLILLIYSLQQSRFLEDDKVDTPFSAVLSKRIDIFPFHLANNQAHQASHLVHQPYISHNILEVDQLKMGESWKQFNQFTKFNVFSLSIFNGSTDRKFLKLSSKSKSSHLLVTDITVCANEGFELSERFKMVGISFELCIACINWYLLMFKTWRWESLSISLRVLWVSQQLA